MQTIAIANQKGGCGKTTTTLALGAGLAETGRRVLLVDIDPQSSLTQWLGVHPNGGGLADVLGGADPGSQTMAGIIQPVKPGLDLAPADIALSGCEVNLVQRWGREFVIKSALEQVANNYDVALLDCPPSLGVLTIAALTAAQGVIVPTLPAAADLRGLRLFLDTLQKVRAALNPGLDLAGVVVVQFDKRLTAHNMALDALQSAGLPVWLPTVPRSVRVQEAAGVHDALTEYDPSGKATAAYNELTNEVIKWLTK